MKMYSEVELEILNIQIGCMLRLARLKKNLSQLDLSLLIGSNPTMIGRVERFENVSGWDKIVLLSQRLDVDFYSLFDLKNEDELLLIIEESFVLENKLTQEKKDYYVFLKKEIIIRYNLLLKNR